MTRLNPQDARQGRKGAPVLRILILGLVLCAVAALVMVAYAYVMPDQTLPDASVGGGTTSSAPADPSASSSTTTTPAQTGTNPAPASPAPAN